MTRPTMLPSEADGYLVKMDEQQVSTPAPWVVRHALETIAAMSVEECGRVLTMEETGGKHEVKTTYRLVGEWVDKHDG